MIEEDSSSGSIESVGGTVLQAAGIAAIPSLAMLFGGMLMICIKQANPKFQAMMQNLSAGIILAAVAGELFPLMRSHQKDWKAMLGLSLGFFLGLGVMFGFVISLCFDDYLFGHNLLKHSIRMKMLLPEEEEEEEGGVEGEKHNEEKKEKSLNTKKLSIFDEASEEYIEMNDISGNLEEPIDDEAPSQKPGYVEPEDIQAASTSPAEPNNSNHSLSGAVPSSPTGSPSLTRSLLRSNSLERPDTVNNLKATFSKIKGTLHHLQEHLERKPDRFSIDKHVHELEYLVDSSRLHLRGNKRALSKRGKVRALPYFMQGNNKTNTYRFKAQIRKQLEEVNSALSTIESHIERKDPSAAAPDPDEVDREIQLLELNIRSIMSAYESWRPPFAHHRWEPVPEAPPPDQRPDILPWPLIFAVLVDCFVDGFLVGLSFVASSHVGFVMAAATCIEMGFLGLSFSGTIKIATSNKWKHFGVVFAGPLVLTLAGVVGSAIGAALEQYPSVFSGFISFSVVALLFLVTQELLIEARENVEGKEIWWINVWLFLGVFIVLITSEFIES